MDQRINILFFILLGFKSFYPITAIQHQSLNYDITGTIQNAINGILQTVDSKKIDNLVEESEESTINSMHNPKLKNMIVTLIRSRYLRYISRPSIYSNFITNETYITIESYGRNGEARFIYPGTSKLVDKISYYPPVIRNVTLKVVDEISYYPPAIRNVSIKIIGSSEKNPKEKFVIDFPSDFGTENYDVYYRGPRRYNSRKCRKLKQLLGPLIILHMKQKFVALSKNISDNLKYHSRTIFTSSHPNLSEEPQQYINLVPNTSYFCFNLRNITIRGLTNFVSLNKTEDVVNNFEINLAIKNIRGELILDYGSEIEKPMQLNFLAEYVFIRANQSNNRTNVEIQNYHVFRTERNISLTDQQSAIIIQHIESAIASSLMPSMTIWRTNDQLAGVYDMQSQFGKMIDEVKNKNFILIKLFLCKWIPFNEHQTDEIDKATTSTLIPTPAPKIRENQTDTHQYNIQFQNITIKLISGNLNRREIQCEFPKSLKIIHDVNAASGRKFHWNSNKGDGIDISFHANFTSINFSQITANSSRPNNCCEFQLENNENIKVDLAPDRSIAQNPDLKLKKKIDKTLISMAKERFVRNIKQTVCFPFEVCSQAATIANDFFQHFIDELLKKCSLR